MNNSMEIKPLADLLAEKWDISAAVTVMEGDAVLHDAVYGFADRDEQRPLTASARYCFSLYSPLLLGLGALLLFDEKKLRFGDRLDRYLPEYPHAERITVRNLFRRQSGIPECLSGHLIPRIAAAGLPEAERMARERACSAVPPSFSEALTLIGSTPLAYVPGTDSDYSDAEPLFMRELVERVADMPLFDLLEERVFGPLGMADTVRGAHTDCACFARDLKDALVRMPTPPQEQSFTTTQADLCRLLAAFQERALLSARAWEEALRYSKDGQGIGFMELNGLVLCELEHPYGFAGAFVFAQRENGLRYAVTFNEAPLAKMKSGRWRTFCSAFRTELEAMFAQPAKPELVRYSRRNAFEAMALELADGQESYVPDARSCLCWAYASGRDRSAYVLMDEGRAIGLLVLGINRRQNRFSIADVLIDRRYQHRGYGKAMVTMGLEILRQNGAKELTLYCVRDNVAACRLYQSVGFETVAIFDDVQEMRCKL